MSDNPLLDAALRYADNGWAVFPLHGIDRGACTCRKPKCTDQGKHPRTTHGLKDATTDPDKIRDWWEIWPASNIGIATGQDSGIWVLDIDNKQTVEVGLAYVGLGDQSIRELEEEHGLLPDTATVQTGGGGTHLYFAWPDGGDDLRNRTGVRPGVDVRGNGGYVVAPPSSHLSGHPYRWVDDLAYPGLAPAWTVATVLAPSLDDAPPDDDSPFPEGKRNDSLHDLGQKLRKEKCLTERQLFGILMAENAARCVPPLDVGEVKRIAANVAKYDCIKTMPSIDAFDDTKGNPPEFPEGGDLAISLHDLITNPPKAPPPLIYLDTPKSDGEFPIMLHAGTGIILAGPPNAGKTWLMMDLMLAVASGGYWLGKYKAEQGPVLFVDEEGHPYGNYERFQKLLDGRGYLPSVGLPLHLSLGAGIRLDTDVGLTRFRRMLERYGPRLVVLDSLVRFNSSDENDARGMANFFAITKQLMQFHDVAFCFTHHVRKPSLLDDGDIGNALRGTSEIRAWPDWIGVLSPDLVLHNVKQRWGRREEDALQISLGINDDDGTAAPFVSGVVTKEDKTKAGQQNKILKAIQDLDDAKDWPTIEAISDVVQRSERTVRDYVNTMVAKNVLEAEYGVTIPGTRGSKTIYHIK